MRRCGLIYFDDLNIPFKETYSAQPPIEILRQMFILTPFGDGWCDCKGGDFHQLVDLHMLAAMYPPGTGKDDITDRCSRCFNLIFVKPFDDESLQRIFNTVVTEFLSAWQRDEVALAPSAVAATLESYNIVLKELLLTPAKSHHTFNMRDVPKVFQGICQCTHESLPKGDNLAKVGYHECERVFRDRLVTKQDHGGLFSPLKSNMNENHVGGDESWTPPEYDAGIETYVNLAEYMLCVRASLRSLLSKGWSTVREVAWIWL
jgi:dynein heavy chain